jgi:hypothetical protein
MFILVIKKTLQTNDVSFMRTIYWPCSLYQDYKSTVFSLSGLQTDLFPLSGLGLGLWCLTPLSTIFQLYRGSIKGRCVNLIKGARMAYNYNKRTNVNLYRLKICMQIRKHGQLVVHIINRGGRHKLALQWLWNEEQQSPWCYIIWRFFFPLLYLYIQTYKLPLDYPILRCNSALYLF